VLSSATLLKYKGKGRKYSISSRVSQFSHVNLAFCVLGRRLVKCSERPVIRLQRYVRIKRNADVRSVVTGISFE
jgi:hypothetical protein